MSAPVGNPNGLRLLASTWSTAAEADAVAMDSLLLAGMATAAAVQGAETAGSLQLAVTAPTGSLDGAGRLLASACSVLLRYADELQLQQSTWAAAQVMLDQLAGSQEPAFPLTPARMIDVMVGDLDLARAEADRSALQAAAENQRAAARAAADTAAAAAVIELSTISAQLELLGARSIVDGAVPTSAAAAPSVGQVPSTSGAKALPPFLATMLPHWSQPAQVRTWWDGLAPEEKLAVTTSFPDWVGQADGLPAEVRDEANRKILAKDLATVDTAMDALGLDRESLASEEGRAEVSHRLAEAGWTEEQIGVALGAAVVSGQLRTAREREPEKEIQLYVYEPGAFDGRGRAAISIGDLDSAANVSVLVPGMTSQVPEYLDGHVQDGLDLAASSDQQGLDTAVLAYIGYEAPDMEVAGLGTGLAEEGARVLTDDVEGLTASRGEDDPWLTLIGHSYGGVTLSTALADHGLAADAVVLAQVPGAGTASSVDDYAGVDPSHVFVLAESDDPVPLLGLQIRSLGEDPAAAGFGAIRLYAETGASGFDAHSSMFLAGGWPLRNLTMVSGNRLDRIRVSAPRQSSPILLTPFRIPVDPDATQGPQLPGSGFPAAPR